MNNPIQTLTDAKRFGFQFLPDQIATDTEAEGHAPSKR
ncbi:hypothetical protein YpK1973002_1567 [Yersinia pestis biovar Mediaevalis str. K1973002]|nr:hypothetical protein YpK1973002_1567 [Yersinia pestis biovar Mediaevalis str. K1973002]